MGQSDVRHIKTTHMPSTNSLDFWEILSNPNTLVQPQSFTVSTSRFLQSVINYSYITKFKCKIFKIAPLKNVLASSNHWDEASSFFSDRSLEKKLQEMQTLSENWHSQLHWVKTTVLQCIKDKFQLRHGGKEQPLWGAEFS